MTVKYDYEVCESHDVGTLKAEVRILLNAGWKLAGGASMVAYRDSRGDLNVWYCQALILEMQEQDSQ